MKIYEPTSFNGKKADHRQLIEVSLEEANTLQFAVDQALSSLPKRSKGRKALEVMQKQLDAELGVAL